MRERPGGRETRGAARMAPTRRAPRANRASPQIDPSRSRILSKNLTSQTSLRLKLSGFTACRPGGSKQRRQRGGLIRGASATRKAGEAARRGVVSVDSLLPRSCANANKHSAASRPMAAPRLLRRRRSRRIRHRSRPARRSSRTTAFRRRRLRRTLRRCGLPGVRSARRGVRAGEVRYGATARSQRPDEGDLGADGRARRGPGGNSAPGGGIGGSPVGASGSVGGTSTGGTSDGGAGRLEGRRSCVDRGGRRLRCGGRWVSG